MITGKKLRRYLWLYCTLLLLGASSPAITAQSSTSQAITNSSTTPLQTTTPTFTADVATNEKTLHIVTQPLEVSAQAHEIYFYQLLELALEKTRATHGPYKLERLKRILSNQRYIAEVSRDDGIIDITWTMIDEEREKKLLPIKISLLRGMNSYRVFLIRQEDKEKFRAVNTLEDLKKFNAGSGSVWPDTSILQNNGLPVVTSAHYELLFTMLQRKRFDYFPRGVYEVWTEQKAHADKGFIIEDSLMFHYPAPIYFFVNKNNTRLAERIERGLQIAIEDGSFEQLFFSTPGFEQGYKEIHNPNRRILRLNALNHYDD